MMATTLATGRAPGSDAEDDDEEAAARAVAPEMHPGRGLEGGARPGRRLLLVLDLNGLLLDSFDRGDERPPNLAYVHVGRKWIYKRPGVEEFLHFCFSRFDVGVWSCAREANVWHYVEAVFPEELQPKLVFVWGQERCTDTGQRVPSSKLGKRVKPLFLKELAVLWEEFPEYGMTNTIMVDDTPYKSLRNPTFTAIFPKPYSAFEHDLDDGALARVVLPWLEELCVSNETVQSYVIRKPLGEPAISPSHPDWGLYREVVYGKTFTGPAKKHSDSSVDAEWIPDQVEPPILPTPSAPRLRSSSLPFPLPVGWPEEALPSQEPEFLPLISPGFQFQPQFVAWTGQQQPVHWLGLPQQQPLQWVGDQHQSGLWMAQMSQYFQPVSQQVYLQGVGNMYYHGASLLGQPGGNYVGPITPLPYLHQLPLVYGTARGDNLRPAGSDDDTRRPRSDSHSRYHPY